MLEGSSGREFEKAIKGRRPDAAVYYVDNRGAISDKNEILKHIAMLRKWWSQVLLYMECRTGQFERSSNHFLWFDGRQLI